MTRRALATLMLSGSLLLWQAGAALAETTPPTCHPDAAAAGTTPGQKADANTDDGAKNDAAKNDAENVTAGENLQVQEDSQQADLNETDGDKNNTDAATVGEDGTKNHADAAAACNKDDKNQETANTEHGSTSKKP